jgi:hypothetical protein
MFSVIFEVRPKPDEWDTYLGNAQMLRPALEQVDGFIDNIRYKCLTREGWVLSLSGWRDTAKRPEQWAETTNPDDCAEFLGLNPYAEGMLSYDVFDAVVSPGDLILLCSWQDKAAAEAFETGTPGPIPPGGVSAGSGLFETTVCSTVARLPNTFPTSPSPCHDHDRHRERGRDGKPNPPDDRARLLARPPRGHSAKRDQHHRSPGQRVP